MKRVSIFILTLTLLSGKLLAQAAETDAVPMADKLRADGKIWVVVAVVAIVFAGIAINMLRIDFKLRKIEKELNIK
ncbi:CcmD family protein [Dyadobacter subterraneus]|uniref:CcmD family protein n=1 Tax=Dyadobacter subterraneus TaxID=2773304 RepID=A0ABR9W6Y1_9BACT|nr:CcmD family protein [Dyadobacter subterraneus]MBE9461207.1 CcmD family protein [Dyadobacter subterraneus]